MKKKLIIISISLFVIAALLTFAYLYLTRLYSFTCDKTCTGNNGVEFNVNINKYTKELSINQKGKDFFVPYLPVELEVNENNNSDEVITNKYQKNNNILTIRLSTTEYKKVKKLYNLNEQNSFRYGAPFMAILLNIAYNNDNYCNNDTKCTEYYNKYDYNKNKIITYREVGNGMLDEYINYYKENNITSPYSNKLLLSEFKCTFKENSCIKNITINHNKKKYKIKIEYYYKYNSDNKVSTYYKVSIDGKIIDDEKAIEYILLKNDDENISDNQFYVYQDELEESLNFGGYLLVFGNNIGFIKDIHISEDTSKSLLDIYSNNKKIGETINLSSNFGLDYMKVNKNSLTFKYPVCLKDELVNVEFKIKNGLLNKKIGISSKTSSNEKDKLLGNDYCYNISENKIEKQNNTLEK